MWKWMLRLNASRAFVFWSSAFALLIDVATIYLQHTKRGHVEPLSWMLLGFLFCFVGQSVAFRVTGKLPIQFTNPNRPAR
jgi:hypothetical protein